jgi:hypothetical protein
MTKQRGDCGRFRTEIREMALERRPETEWTPELRGHLTGCAGCRKTADGLRRLPALFPAGDLYTAELRRRTLERTADASAPVGADRMILLAAAAAAGFGVSVALPLWLLSRMLGAVCPTEACALVGAGAIFLLLGIAAAASMALPVLKNEKLRKAAAFGFIRR